MTFAEALEALERRSETRIELGLDRVRAHLRSLGSPQEQVPCLHVAGTNGKGSTCAILEAALRAAGRRTGLYTSPHLFSPLERVRVDGTNIPERAFAELLERALGAECGDRLTYFELLTSVAFQWFARELAEAVVLETGLGGRLDATNVVERPAACAITSIGFDHMQFLGGTLAEIAREKAGIAKRGVPLLCSPLPPDAQDAVARSAASAGAPLTVVAPAYEPAGADWEAGRQRLRGPEGEVELSLLGLRQRFNVSLARAALRAAGPAFSVGEAAWRAALSSVRWPLRFEPRRLGDRLVVLDGAHNAEAAAQLAETWRASPWAGRPALWIVGVLGDKDVLGLLEPLSPHIGRAVAVPPPSPRALDPRALAERLRDAAPRAEVSVAGSAREALARWRAEPGPRAAVVCGSFYLAAEAAAALEEQAHAASL